MYEELISELRKGYTDRVNDAADAIEDLQKLTDAQLDIIKQYQVYLTKQHWISVTERLPQEREWVLCQCRAKIRMVLRLQNGYWHQDSRHEFMSGFVTHWMPLPAPPKEET